MRKDLKPKERPIMILMTDGYDNENHNKTVQKLKEIKKEYPVVNLIIILFGSSCNLSKAEDLSRAVNLGDLSFSIDGEYIEAIHKADNI